MNPSNIQSILSSNLTNTTERFILVVLSFLSNEKGECLISISSIAEKCAINDRTTRRALKNLQTIGLINVSTGGGRIKNCYLLNIDKIKTNQQEFSGVALNPPRGGVQPPPSPSHINPPGVQPPQGWHTTPPGVALNPPRGGIQPPVLIANNAGECSIEPVNNQGLLNIIQPENLDAQNGSNGETQNLEAQNSGKYSTVRTLIVQDIDKDIVSDKDKDKTSTPKSTTKKLSSRKKSNVPNPLFVELMKLWYEGYAETFHNTYPVSSRDGQAIKNLIAMGVDPKQFIETAKTAWAVKADSQAWNCFHHSLSLPSFVTAYQKILGEISQGRHLEPVNGKNHNLEPQPQKPAKLGSFELDETYQRLETELSIMFCREKGFNWTYAEQTTLHEISKRPLALKEIEILKEFREKPESFFPQSLFALLDNWNKTLDRANNYYANKKHTMKDVDANTINVGQHNIYRNIGRQLTMKEKYPEIEEVINVKSL